MSVTKLDQQQVIQHSFDEAVDAIRTVPSGGILVKEAFDYIEASYPNATTEIFVYKEGGSGGTTVATVSITYTDGTKESISTVTRT